MLTGKPPCRPRMARDVLDEFDFGARLRRMNLHLVHERADQKNSSTGSLKQIFRRQGVGDLAHVQPLTLVTNRDYQIDGCSLQYQTDFFAGIVSIAMKHRV